VYPAATAGPIDLFVIKGLVLPPPTVSLVVPAQAQALARIPARIVVSGTDAAPVPGGSVRVRNAETEIASANLVDGSAIVSIAMPASGAVTLTADYSGDGLYPPASSDGVTVLVGVVSAAVASATAIPTLQDWVTGVLALILAASGLRRLRRR
jgi:hypothetical protein